MRLFIAPFASMLVAASAIAQTDAPPGESFVLESATFGLRQARICDPQVSEFFRQTHEDALRRNVAEQAFNARREDAKGIIEDVTRIRLRQRCAESRGIDMPNEPIVKHKVGT